MPRKHRTIRLFALFAALSLALAACSGGENEGASADDGAAVTSQASAKDAADEDAAVDNAADEDADNGAANDGSNDDEAEAATDPSGTVILDDEELPIHNISCLQPPVNDGLWRVFIALKNGDLTMDEDGTASGTIDGVTWLQSSGDDMTYLDVSEHGASGTVEMHPSGDDTLTVDDTAILEADITC